jgi:hypothetical protein
MFHCFEKFKLTEGVIEFTPKKFYEMDPCANS